MADQLCAPEDLASLLERDLDAYKAIMLVECGTAVVQEAAGNQRLIEVEDDPGEVMGLTDSWLALPQRPATAISDVEIDSSALVLGTDFKRFGSRLWRRCGWATSWTEPSLITFTYTHGYAADSQDLQLARNAVLSLIRSLFDNPNGMQREAIDDYSATYEAMTQQMQAWPGLRASLLRKYGTRAGLVRLG
jgi:hypothetical protein